MKKITISIPKPCHENWANMTPSQQGRFCGACQKEVIDFTAMTDDELFRFFADKTKQNVCGRTLPYQLNSPIAKPVEHKKKRFWYISYLTSLLLFFGKSETKAQTKPEITTSPVPTPTPAIMGAVAYVPVIEEIKNTVITGNIKDESGNPVPFATIVIERKKTGTTADAQGNFKINAKAGDILSISATGYETRIFSVVHTGNQPTYVIQYKRARMGMIVVRKVNEDDDVAPDVPRHIAAITVVDNSSNNAIANAKVSIIRNSQHKQKTRYTSSKGFYELRNIKETDSYQLTFEAAGYKPKWIEIRGTDFHKRKIEKMVLLEKAETATVAGNIVAVTTKELLPENKNVTLAEVLAGRMGCGIVQNTQPVTLLPNNATPPAINTISKPVIDKTAASIIAYPNPATENNSITITTSNVKAGNYTLLLATITGEVLHNKPVQLLKASSSFALNTAHPKNAGIYVIRLINASGLEEASCKLVVQ